MTTQEETQLRIHAFLARHGTTAALFTDAPEMIKRLRQYDADQKIAFLMDVVKFRSALLLMEQTALPWENRFVTANRALNLAETWPDWLPLPLPQELAAFCADRPWPSI